MSGYLSLLGSHENERNIRNQILERHAPRTSFPFHIDSSGRIHIMMNNFETKEERKEVRT